MIAGAKYGKIREAALQLQVATLEKTIASISQRTNEFKENFMNETTAGILSNLEAEALAFLEAICGTLASSEAARKQIAESIQLLQDLYTRWKVGEAL